MLEKLRGVMIPLGHGKFVLSDVIIAVEPLPIGYYGKHSGVKVRSRVLINHAVGEILASRTAETILKSMTKQDDKVIEDDCGIRRWAEKLNDYHVSHSGHIPNRSEKDIITSYLVENSTVRHAIEASPYGRSKFYKLLKKHNIDPKPYLNATNDPDGLV